MTSSALGLAEAGDASARADAGAAGWEVALAVGVTAATAMSPVVGVEIGIGVADGIDVKEVVDVANASVVWVFAGATGWVDAHPTSIIARRTMATNVIGRKVNAAASSLGRG
jgi:hypothetical protein